MLFAGQLVSAQVEDERHPIEVALEAATDADQSTAGMCRALVEASDGWEKEIISSCQKLKILMTPEEWERFKVSQKAWELYKDLEYASQVEMYSNMEGTVWRVVSSAAQMGLYKNRAKDLLQYVVELEGERGE